MDALLLEIAGKAVADYGFRQTVLWSGSEVADRWGLSTAETQILLGPVLEALPGELGQEDCGPGPEPNVA